LGALVRARGDGSAAVRRGKLDPVPVTQLSEGEKSILRKTELSAVRGVSLHFSQSTCGWEKEEVLSTLVYWS